MLGFGSTEQQAEEQIKTRCFSALVRGGWKELARVRDEWNAQNDYNTDSPQVPERFTRFWTYGGAIHFQHVNTRHPFSPDGWAAINTEWVYDEAEHKGNKIDE